jgi:hypothetical protein
LRLARRAVEDGREVALPQRGERLLPIVLAQRRPAPAIATAGRRMHIRTPDSRSETRDGAAEPSHRRRRTQRLPAPLIASGTGVAR